LGSSPSGLGEDGRDWWDIIGWNSLEAGNLRKLARPHPRNRGLGWK